MEDKLSEKKLETCENEEIQYAELIDNLKGRYLEKKQEKAWLKEETSWRNIIKRLIAGKNGIQFNYRINSVLDIGGAGAVFRVIDCNLFKDLEGVNPSEIGEKQRRAYRALKVPRPHSEKGSTLADSLRSEVSKLTSLSHPNIVSIYAKGQISLQEDSAGFTWPWFIMDYLDNATDLQKLCSESPPGLPELIKYFFDVGKGLKYIHDNGLVHCDVKPANIFLSQSEDKRFQSQAILADFGYAKHINQNDGETTIGFTEYYAHPLLKDGARVSSQKSRSFNKISRMEISPAFDMFSLGLSINSLIDKYYFRYHIYRKYSYEIKYLRLCAARLLDGYNHVTETTFANLPYYAYKDIEEKNSPKYVKGIKYRDIGEFVEDIKKLIGEYNPEIEIPELIDTRRENIQVSDSAPVVYSERVRNIVDLPIVRRLSSVTQLGLLSLVYPGGSHTRLEHSLGTFGVTAKYIVSLYNDTLSPMFRQLVTAKQIKKTLLASLLHDIGQYPLAHDLEDVSKNFFGHENLGKLILGQSEGEHTQYSLLLPSENTIGQMAEALNNVLFRDWGVTLSDVRKVVDAKSSDNKRIKQSGSHVDRLCKSLIDGPIDSDKLDYLERDSRHCNVQYGLGVDRQRLFKCLTVACENISDENLLIVLGVHEKGRISAESLLFARYAMLTQVYWHHTMRSIKALLHFAASEILNNVRSIEMESLKNSFFECAILEKVKNTDDWNELKNNAIAATNIHPGDLRVISWLWENTTQLGKQAISHIVNRNVFKRALSLYSDEFSHALLDRLNDIFKPERYKQRIKFRLNIENAIKDKLMRMNFSEEHLLTMGFSESEWKKRLEEVSLHCLVDYPAPREGSEFGLKVVGQWGERPKKSNQTEINDIPNVKHPKIIHLDHFKNGMKQVEKSIACLRVFWHPKEFDILKDTLKDDDLKEIVMKEIRNFKD